MLLVSMTAFDRCDDVYCCQLRVHTMLNHIVKWSFLEVVMAEIRAALYVVRILRTLED